MKDAPAVVFPVGRTPALGLALAALWLAGALLVSAAVLQQQDGVRNWTSLVLLLASLLTGGGLLRFWRRQQARRLVWDGACWGLQEGGSASVDDDARVEVRLDLQRAALLLYRDPSRRRSIWLWAQAADDLPRWHLLRCALYSSSKSVVRFGAGAVVERS